MEDGGNGSHNFREDLGRGCEAETEDPELVRPSFYHEANRDEQEPAGRRPAGPGRPSSRPDGWNEGLTVESPSGSETR